MVRATGLDLHFLLWQKINVRLGQALGGNARPHCNGSVQVLHSFDQKEKRGAAPLFFLACIYKGDTISKNATQGRSALHSLND